MVCFIVLHYLVSEETVNCVNTLINIARDNDRIVIVDNDSPNDSFNVLECKFSNENNVNVIRNVKNTGYAGGINFGYDYAKREFSPEYIIAMNNDIVIPQADFVDALDKVYKDTKFDVLGPDIISTATGKHQNPERHTILTLEDINREINYVNKLKKKQLSLEIKSKIKQYDILSKLYYAVKKPFKSNRVKTLNEVEGVALHGSFLVYSKKAIAKREYALYPKTNFYCEAQILDYECKRDGLIQVFSPRLKVEHHEDVATNAVKGNLAKKMNGKYIQLLDSLGIFRELIVKDLEG